MRKRAMLKVACVIGAGLIAVTATAFGDRGARAQDAPAGDAVEGKRLYRPWAVSSATGGPGRAAP
jgi:hypothetical protein